MAIVVLFEGRQRAWMIESPTANLRVGNGPAGRVHWLQPGTSSALSEHGPSLTFEGVSPAATAPRSRLPTPPLEEDVVELQPAPPKPVAPRPAPRPAPAPAPPIEIRDDDEPAIVRTRSSSANTTRRQVLGAV